MIKNQSIIGFILSGLFVTISAFIAEKTSLNSRKPMPEGEKIIHNNRANHSLPTKKVWSPKQTIQEPQANASKARSKPIESPEQTMRLLGPNLTADYKNVHELLTNEQ